MTSQPARFDAVDKDPLVNKIIRKSFRVPVDQADDVWIKVDDHRYPVRDICLDGVGITLDEPSAFSISQIITHCDFHVASRDIRELNGRVVHFSLNSGKDWQCGIQWIDMSGESMQLMSEIVNNLKTEFLKGDNQVG